jgi:predicted phosphodiesterase
MRIAVLSDLHANLPFAESAIRMARLSGSDRIVHLGDAVDLGPWPSETLDLLISENVEMVRGNHDEYPVMGLTPGMASRLSPEIREHMDWTASQLRTDQLAILAGLPPQISSRADEWRVRLQHFVLDGNRVSERMVGRDPASMIEAFEIDRGEIVCFGHIHTRSWHYAGDRGYLNPGATGFLGEDGGFFAQLILQEESAWIEWRKVDCPHDYVVSELERRNVPGWESSATYMFAEAV